MEPKVQFAKRRDGVRIAYMVYGKGEPLVFPAGWITNMLFSNEDLTMQAFLEPLARQFTLVFYDKHGCGLSDRNRTDFSLESELQDLDTIIKHLCLECSTLFGISAGGTVSVAYAVQCPQRVKNLILYGTYADGKKIGNVEVQSTLVSLIKSAWGLGSRTLANIFMPNADKEFTLSFSRCQRESCSAEVAANLLQLTYRLDVADSLSRIQVPTLVLHRKGDKIIPFRLGRELAMGIPNATFKMLEGDAHFPWMGDSNTIVKEILEFTGKREPLSQSEKVTGQKGRRKQTFSGDSAEKRLDATEQATIVFSDIVSSTDLVTNLGDLEARAIFLHHDKIVRSQLDKHWGRELQNLGDGFMLSFPSASSAIKFACDVQTELSKKLPKVKIRMGINSGEVVTREGGHPFGQAVVLASRIASKAKGEQILVSDVTRQLVAGSGMPLTEKGRVRLKGFPGSHKVFELNWKEIRADSAQ